MDRTKLSKLLDVIFFVIGPVVLIVNVFNFGHNGRRGSIYIEYDAGALIAIGVGVALIAFGLLRIYWNKNKDFS